MTNIKRLALKNKYDFVQKRTIIGNGLGMNPTGAMTFVALSFILTPFFVMFGMGIMPNDSGAEAAATATAAATTADNLTFLRVLQSISLLNNMASFE